VVGTKYSPELEKADDYLKKQLWNFRKPMIIILKKLQSFIFLERVLVVEEAGVPGENHRPWASNW
jgi:hypothetical protein